MSVDEAMQKLKKAINDQYWDARDGGLCEARRAVSEMALPATSGEGNVVCLRDVVDYRSALLQKINGLMQVNRA